MVGESEKAPLEETEATGTEDEGFFEPVVDGMSTGTARIAISRKLRERLMRDYDLLELRNEGRYYVAKALSKDGHWHYEMMIDKENGNVRIYNEQPVRREKAD